MNNAATKTKLKGQGEHNAEYDHASKFNKEGLVYVPKHSCGNHCPDNYKWPYMQDKVTV